MGEPCRKRRRDDHDVGHPDRQAGASEAALMSREDATCPICLDVIGKVVESPCGHLFCLKCISAQRMSQNSRGSVEALTYQCPVCRSPSRWCSDDHLPQGWQFSRFLQRKIDSIPVTCPHPGCGAVTRKGEMSEHAAGCAHAPPRPTIPRLNVPLPTDGEDQVTALCPAGVRAGDRVELALQGLQGTHWQCIVQCIVPSGVKPGQRFNARLGGLLDRVQQMMTPAGESNTERQAAVPVRPRPPRPPESDLWRTAWCERYHRWYWWNTDTRSTTWFKPHGVSEMM